jgi:hypothetical protein
MWKTQHRPARLALLVITAAVVAVVGGSIPAAATPAALSGPSTERAGDPGVDRVQPRAAAFYLIKFGHSLKCVTSPDDFRGSVLVQRSCDYSNVRQYWGLSWTANGYAVFANWTNGMCIRVQGGSWFNGAWIIQEHCSYAEKDANWKGDLVPHPPPGWYNFRPLHAVSAGFNRCLTVKDASFNENAPLVLFTCISGDISNDEITYLQA